MSKEYILITSVAREKKDGPLPRLIDDMRENSIYAVSSQEGSVYCKPPSTPYAASHMLVVPDNNAKTDMPGVIHIPDPLLTTTLRTAATIASFYFQRADSVDIGFNYSEHEPEKIIASQRKNFHAHVMALRPEEAAQTISKETALNNENKPQFKTQTSEPLAPLISEILLHEVLDKEFNDLFEATQHNSPFPTFRFIPGTDGFSSPQLATALKKIHEKSQIAYTNLASCFLTEDITEEKERYHLRPLAERKQNIQEYIQNRSWLSKKAKHLLEYLTAHAQQMIPQPEERTQHKDIYIRHRMLAIKNLAYACVFSGKKQENTISWTFGFDPAVFSNRDILQASRNNEKLFVRKANETLDPDVLTQMQQEEQQLIAFLNQNLG